MAEETVARSEPIDADKTLNEIKTAEGWRVEIVKDDRSISRLWIIDRQMRIGSCPVYTGGIAGVGTDEEYRNQGLSRRVMQASLALMQRESYDASILFGIEDFCHKFGFATCMPERRLYLCTRDAERAQKHLRIRAMRPADLAAIKRIYNRDNAARTASVVRDRTWKPFAMGSFFGIEARIQVVLDDKDRVVGYLAYDEVSRHCRAAEVGGRGDEVFSTILQCRARRAVELRKEQLSFSLPVDHPFARFCRQYGCRDSTHFDRNAGPMGRLIAVDSFLVKILPVLAERWGTADRALVLGFKTAIGSCAIGWHRERLQRLDISHGALSVRVDQDALMQLAMGYLTAGDLKAQDKLRASSGALALLEQLFPQQTAHMWWADRI